MKIFRAIFYRIASIWKLNQMVPYLMDLWELNHQDRSICCTKFPSSSINRIVVSWVVFLVKVREALLIILALLLEDRWVRVWWCDGGRIIRGFDWWRWPLSGGWLQVLEAGFQRGKRGLRMDCMVRSSGREDKSFVAWMFVVMENRRVLLPARGGLAMA